jgi:CO/xanthine dehydrogenase FAD-binding subunit
MKPTPFDYCCPDLLDEVLTLLAQYGDDAKIIAGGQSLMPMMNFRVVRPSLVIDIRRLLELDRVDDHAAGGLRIGALTRHRVLETSPLVRHRFPVIGEAMRHVAHLAIRNRGTIGGSLSHADPAAELPMLVRLLDGQIRLQSVRGLRTVAAEQFFLGPLTTALAADELLVAVDLPGLPAHGSAFEEFSRRAGDFALAAIGVILEYRDGRLHRARVGAMGVADTPLRLPAVESALIGATDVKPAIVLAVQALRDTLRPRTDLHASADYRAHLASVLLERTLLRAWGEAVAAVGEATP